ncbi:YqzL family protein [Alteribacillus sp. HJP-4]|uniref:YqzL family protein n=1 Tax=Alteribacillus sp. HJP-4 TaxID=2775394 RepID=UPI0035CCD2E2
MNSDFSWSLFELTGNVDAYLLVRELEESGYFQKNDSLTIIKESGSESRSSDGDE